MSNLFANLLFLAVGLGLSAIWGLYAARQSHRRGRREAELEAAPLSGKTADLEARLRDLEARLEKERGALQEALSQKSALEAVLRELREREPQMRQTLQLELGKFLEDKGAAFNKQSLASLDTLLTPLGNKLKDFEKKVETTYQQERDQHTQLKTQIDLLYKMNQSLGQEAKNLTQALKGENKTGGNWGEVILERVLEISGLQKDREYSVQKVFTTEENVRKQPDVVVYLPGKRHLVIDSKLSLVAYERYCSAETPEQARLDLDAHIQSVRNHVKNLSEQRYQDIWKLQSIDFVFLFMPIEPAFIEAAKQDPALFQEAFAKNIILVSPSTLLATLRTVANVWKQEYQSQNAHKIAQQAGDLYDKFVGFLEDLQSVGKGLALAQNSFDAAKNKLTEGKGNLIGRVERLKELKAKASKEIPKAWKDALDEEPGTPGDSENRLPL